MGKSCILIKMGLLKKLAIYTTSNGFTYDALGNVVTKQTANLKKEGKTINLRVRLRSSDSNQLS